MKEQLSVWDAQSGSFPPGREQEKLLSKAATSLKWSILGNAVPRLITPISTMVLAALLTPTDFGLVAIATLVMALAQIIVDMGLGTAVIQRRTLVNEAASIALFISLTVAIILFLVLFIIAPWIAKIYNTNEMIDVIRVAALALPLYAFSSIPKAILQRNLEFNRLFWVMSSLLITQALSSVVLAFVGAGYWALVYGQLVGVIVSAILSWVLARWRPRIIINWCILRSLLGFSLWVMASSFQTWLFLYADNAIAGFFLGAQGLGIYSLGFNLANILPGFVVSSLSAVAYPFFCTLQEKPLDIGRNLLKLQTFIGVILFPMAFGLSATGTSIVGLLYGDKWLGLGIVIGFLAIMPGLSHIWSLNADAYRSIGRPDVWTKVAGFTLLILMPFLWIAGHFGLLAFTFARFGCAWLLPLGNIIFGAPIIGINIKEQLKAFASPLFCAVIMFVLVQILMRLLNPFVGLIGWLKLFLTIGIGMVTYLLLLWRVNRYLWNQFQIGIRQVFFYTIH